MSHIEIERIDITDLITDAIVNAANEELQEGGGVCGAIFRKAGSRHLQEACNRIGHCDTGSAIITPGFNTNAKYIIHAVGPRWIDGHCHESEYLYGAYYRSLELACENKCKSIGFPLISAGIFHYPVDQAWKVALEACSNFLDSHPEKNLLIIFAIRDPDILTIGQRCLSQFGAGNSVTGRAIQASSKMAMDKISIDGDTFSAVYFHRPEEPNGYLSNWYVSSFTLDEMHFTSVEQYIMYRKCKLFGDEYAAAAVLDTDDVEEQKAIGKKAKGYNDRVWAGIRQAVAYRALYAKFSQNKDLKNKLLDTGDAYLVECARTDKIWACGIHLDDNAHCYIENWSGKNILGFALMEVRKALLNE